MIQESSANLMTFLVNDFIDLAQIKNQKFRKNIQQFDIMDAVEEVMSIQRHSAKDKNINFYATYVNIDPKYAFVTNDSIIQKSEKQYSPLINSDKKRIQQVLLNI